MTPLTWVLAAVVVVGLAAGLALLRSHRDDDDTEIVVLELVEVAVCQLCGYVANDARDEVDHMQTVHPEAVVARLERAGMHYEAELFRERSGMSRNGHG